LIKTDKGDALQEAVLKQFLEICQIPHCSFDTELLKEYIVKKCSDGKTKVVVDSAGNILASKGKNKVCLQAHYDMVCIGDEVNPYEKDGYLHSKNSTLGADNGVGVAIMLYLLEKHDDIECLFTNDEEVGLLGAHNLNLQPKSSYLLNLDSEEEGAIFIGSAGSVQIDSLIPLKLKEVPKGHFFYEISSPTFKGGHSGLDIDKNIPNAIIELVKFLKNEDLKLISLDGGEQINSIPTNAKAIIATMSPVKKEGFIVKKIEKSTNFYIENKNMVFEYILSFPQGVNSFSDELSLPSKSSNLSKVTTNEELFKVEIFARAVDKKSLDELFLTHKSLLDFNGFALNGSKIDLPWDPNPSLFSKKLKEVALLTWDEVKFKAIHAGLECGVLLKKVDNFKEACSIGPNIKNPHTKDERCEINSIGRVLEIVDNLLKGFSGSLT